MAIPLGTSLLCTWWRNVVDPNERMLHAAPRQTFTVYPVMTPFVSVGGCHITYWPIAKTPRITPGTTEYRNYYKDLYAVINFCLLTMLEHLLQASKHSFASHAMFAGKSDKLP